MALTAYNILSSNSPDRLIAEVVAAAATGWLPLGAAFSSENGKVYNQTMVKGDVGGAPGTGDVYELPEAGAEALGGVLLGDAVADATDAPSVITQLNALIASLVASGALAESV